MKKFPDPEVVTVKAFPVCGVSFSQLQLGR